MTSELARLREIVHTLRSACPWDAEQTHRTLVKHLVEETCEVVDAIETGSDDALVEELGDLLVQVFFHAEIASEDGRFDIEDVARHIADKLVARHPYVYAGADVPSDLEGSWERRKAAEKARASVLDGIPGQFSSLARATKVFGRAAKLGQPVDGLGVTPADVPADQIGVAFLRLVAAAGAAGLDPEQEAREALRAVESQLLTIEGSHRSRRDPDGISGRAPAANE